MLHSLPSYACIGSSIKRLVFAVARPDHLSYHPPSIFPRIQKICLSFSLLLAKGFVVVATMRSER